MKTTLLILNKRSGTAGAVDEEALFTALKGGGYHAIATVILPWQDVPSRADIEAAGYDAIAILSGDGTIASVYHQMADWGGELLILPGGTMNLLSRRLHGDAPVGDVLARLGKGAPEARLINVIRTEKGDVLTGLTVGSSTEWGAVREEMRQGNVEQILAKASEAWSSTTENHSVYVEGDGRKYPSIFVEPTEEDTLHVIGIRADGARDMIAHGVAWLKRDFRQGPNDSLGQSDHVTIIDDADSVVGLLIDGEKGQGVSPLVCHSAPSRVKFAVIA